MKNVKVVMYFEVEETGLEEIEKLEHHADYLLNLDEYPEIKSVYGVEVFADGQIIGSVADVLDYPGNKVYVVKGQYSYMIPAVKAFILATDLDNNRMDVKLIEGMRTDEN